MGCCGSRRRTAGLSTTLRSGRDDNVAWKQCLAFPNKIAISTGGVMGLRPTQGNEKRLGPASTLYGTVTLSLSSRPERRDLRFPRTFRGDVFSTELSVVERSAVSLGRSRKPAKSTHISPPVTTGFMMHKARFNSLHDVMREPLHCYFLGEKPCELEY